ncbi:hypothetical protein [Ralstonia sp. 24A2]|uniref:hypothetical protein n=1 Tax=Ralstonia sp. 24A2 TaxID=3447364 RepID=UPI003F6A36D6
MQRRTGMTQDSASCRPRSLAADSSIELVDCHHLPVARRDHKRGRQKQNACISTLTQALFITRSA